MTTATAKNKYFPLAKAAEFFPPGRDGGLVHPVSLTRWILIGIKAPGGRRVKLAAVRCGSRWMVSKESAEQFMLDCACPANSTEVVPQTTERRRRAHDQATRMLDEAGI
jgi:hypothetical protein